MGFPDTAPGQKMFYFYNVVHAVGKGCPNVRDDVKLVQYLLKSFYDKAVGKGISKPAGELEVTGDCESVTMHWILQFQFDMNKAYPGKIAIDNRVDRIRQKDFVGSISKTIYTLGCLNANCITFNPEAFFLIPALIPLENPMNVPPPSWDTINETPVVVPASGGM
jgi:hypothetical protein